MIRRSAPLLVTSLMLGVTVAVAPPAVADIGWIAVAKSASHEALDWGGGPGYSQADAEIAALRLCAQMQPAGDCYVVASGPSSAAVAWDVAEPLNNAYGATGLTPSAALSAAEAAAGPFANDPEVRCSYLNRG
ncbi:hypothetical protein MMAGJ_41400 [Mycolicibacterium mageritense]|uniref:DUF4189 domain-containing protein n=1 Tax=Mycolicibacterium mageritense TaxID=53462 RepID=A0ABN5Y9N5_MYCME|nr:hypothetical protein MMAGJ_41400 [Mycolicibacterium mageritense]CDO20623.1 hypothetical protein BN978_01080 [Mycolicibacterium mageritense DSM 44476 = CIP 104973]